MRASLALFETAIRSLLHTGRSNTFIDAWAVLYRIAELSNVNTALKPAASGVPGDENIDVARRGAIRLLEIILDEVEGGTKG